MTYVEFPLWVVICFFAAFTLMTIHLIVGDFIAKFLHAKLKQEEKETKYRITEDRFLEFADENGQPMKVDLDFLLGKNVSLIKGEEIQNEGKGKQRH